MSSSKKHSVQAIKKFGVSLESYIKEVRELNEKKYYRISDVSKLIRIVEEQRKAVEFYANNKGEQMELDNLTLGEVKQLKQMLSGDCTTKKEDRGICIVILQRGWVMVGHLSKVGYDCKLEKAAVIRRWGTSNGLGEIAQGGPTEDTKLEPCGVVKFHEMTTVAIIECERDEWIDELS